MATAFPQRRRIVLFLVAVALPTAVLVAVGIRLISQERELQRSRLADDRRAAIAEAGRYVLATLTEIEARALRLLDTGESSVASRDYPVPAVTFLAHVVDSEVLPPWEQDPDLEATRNTLADPEFSRIILEGQRAELGEADPRTAARIYRRAILGAGSDAQAALARLLHARALTSFDRSAAERAYLEVLELPGSVMDENGVPFALFAAARLRGWRGFEERVDRRLESEVGVQKWRSPAAFYLLADLFAGNPAAQAALDEGRVEIESAQALVRNLPAFLNSRSSRSDPGQEVVEWTGVGPGDWLGKAVGSAGQPTAGVLAVSAGALVEELNVHRVESESASGSILFTLAGDSQAVPLGVSRPDLAAIFLGAPEAALGGIVGLRTAFFLTALLLVISITLLGGYLLLRDVKLEAYTAKLRSDFVASVSHEFKTPLTAIRMFAETLNERETADPAVRADYLGTIVGESERLTRLINNLLDLSKIEQGQKTYERTSTLLPEVALRAARAMEYPLAREGFRLTLALDEDLPPISVDGDSVEQAVLNLLTNAMKYSGDSRDIRLSLQKVNEHAVISVRDQGVGVPLEARARLSEKFYRVPSPENDRVPGTGLGLTIVEHTVHAHGGNLTLESEVGVGSIFSIHFPLEESS